MGVLSNMKTQSIRSAPLGQSAAQVLDRGMEWITCECRDARERSDRTCFGSLGRRRVICERVGRPACRGRRVGLQGRRGWPRASCRSAAVAASGGRCSRRRWRFERRRRRCRDEPATGPADHVATRSRARSAGSCRVRQRVRPALSTVDRLREPTETPTPGTPRCSQEGGDVTGRAPQGAGFGPGRVSPLS